VLAHAEEKVEGRKREREIVFACGHIITPRDGLLDEIGYSIVDARSESVEKEEEMEECR
jgi:hypothetical protein